MATDWRVIVRRFRRQLEESGEYENAWLKDFCDFLVSPYTRRSPSDTTKYHYEWKGKQELLAFLNDRRTLSSREHLFHGTWAHLGENALVADVERRDDEHLAKLIASLIDVEWSDDRSS